MEVYMFNLKKDTKISILLFLGGLMCFTFSFLFGIGGDLVGCIIFSVPAQVMFSSVMMNECVSRIVNQIGEGRGQTPTINNEDVRH